MEIENKKVIKAFVLVGIFVFAVALSLGAKPRSSHAATNTTTSALVQLHATVADLTSAGFTGIKTDPPDKQTFLGPTDYFTVADSVSAKTANLPHIVMVDSSSYPYVDQLPDAALYKYSVNDQSFAITGGTGDEATLSDGRTAVSFIKGNNYTLVIGPDKQKTEALALVMAGKVK